jgi:hypothetical protein
MVRREPLSNFALTTRGKRDVGVVGRMEFADADEPPTTEVSTHTIEQGLSFP